MKIHRDIEQQSLEWQMIRAGKVTSSEMDRLVSAKKFEVKKGEGPATYLYEKLAEAWTGAPLPSKSVFAMDQGTILEEYARPAFTLETGMDVETVGFIATDDDRAGCSPDGLLLGASCGLEIKCPEIQTHMKYLCEGKLPDDYILQVQGSLWVTKFPRWFFMSYRRRLPPLILEIEPDDVIQEAISEAVSGFYERFDFAMAKLVELNGGFRPPIQQPLPAIPQGQPADERDDILV